MTFVLIVILLSTLGYISLLGIRVGPLFSIVILNVVGHTVVLLQGLLVVGYLTPFWQVAHFFLTLAICAGGLLGLLLFRLYQVYKKRLK